MLKSYALLESSLTLCLFLGLLWFGKVQKERESDRLLTTNLHATHNLWSGVEVASLYDWAIIGHMIGRQHKINMHNFCALYGQTGTSSFLFAHSTPATSFSNLFSGTFFSTTDLHLPQQKSLGAKAVFE